MTICKICQQDKDDAEFYKVSIIVDNTCKKCKCEIKRNKNPHRKRHLKAINPDNKVCNKCKIEKPKSEFRFDNKSNRFRSICRQCSNIDKETIEVKKYTCHICGMESKLNCLLGRHCNKHLEEKPISKEQYKEDLLTYNGRPPNICPVCNEKTAIPKGEFEYPKYHKGCYETTKLQGVNNPNYRDAQIVTKCEECNKEITKHKSKCGKKKFCSISCSRIFYSKPENQTEAIKQAYIANKETLKKCNNNPIIRAKIAAGQANAFKDGCSKLEINIFNKIKELYPNATNSVAIGWYVVDILIDNIVVEVQGDYWHNLPGAHAKDKRKNTYLTNKGYKVLYIWEHEWHDAKDKELLIKSLLP